MFVHWTSGCLFWTSGCQVEAVAERVKVGYTGQCKYISPFSVAPCVPGVTCGQQLQMGSLSYPHDWMPFNWRGMQKSLKTFCFIFCWLSGSNPTSGRLSEHTLIWTSTTEEKWVNMYYYYAGRGYSGNPDKTLESVSEKSGNIFFFLQTSLMFGLNKRYRTLTSTSAFSLFARSPIMCPLSWNTYKKMRFFLTKANNVSLFW